MVEDCFIYIETHIIFHYTLLFPDLQRKNTRMRYQSSPVYTQQKQEQDLKTLWDRFRHLVQPAHPKSKKTHSDIWQHSPWLSQRDADWIHSGESVVHHIILNLNPNKRNDHISQSEGPTIRVRRQPLCSRLSHRARSSIYWCWHSVFHHLRLPFQNLICQSRSKNLRKPGMPLHLEDCSVYTQFHLLNTTSLKRKLYCDVANLNAWIQMNEFVKTNEFIQCES